MGLYVWGEQWAGAILSGGVATAVILKTVYGKFKEKVPMPSFPRRRESRL